MMRVAVGTLNAAKVKAVEEALCKLDVQIIPVHVPSNVSEQPFSDEETIQGAINRAKNVLQETKADIAIGLEGGVVETEYGMFLCNWGALVTLAEKTILAGGARIALPEEIACSLREGAELGVVMEQYTSQQDVRQKEGAIGVFTSGYVTRSDMFVHIVKMLIGQYMQQTNVSGAQLHNKV